MDEHMTRGEKRAATGRRILAAAQAEFGEHGLERATVRAIARRAEVDPSLVLQHYGSKAGLFAAAIELQAVADDGGTGAHLRDVVAARLAPPSPQTRALLRSMLTSPEAAAVMRGFLDERGRRLAAQSTAGDAELRGALVVTTILGLTIARHFLELDGLAEISDRQVDDVIGPWLDALLEAGPAAPA